MPHKIPTRKVPISVKQNPMVMELDKSHYDVKIYQWDFMPCMDQIIYLHGGKAHFAQIDDVTIHLIGSDKFLLDFMISCTRGFLDRADLDHSIEKS